MILIRTRIAQPLVDNYCVLPKLLTDKVMGIYQTRSPNLLESFLVVQMKKKDNSTEESSQKFEYDTLIN